MTVIESLDFSIEREPRIVVPKRFNNEGIFSLLFLFSSVDLQMVLWRALENLNRLPDQVYFTTGRVRDPSGTSVLRNSTVH